jgi:hypothetical protein
MNLRSICQAAGAFTLAQIRRVGPADWYPGDPADARYRRARQTAGRPRVQPLSLPNGSGRPENAGGGLPSSYFMQTMADFVE